MTVKYDPYSPESWDIEGYGTVYVSDLIFDDNKLIWMRLDEITMEPISADDMETALEPVFWLSSKELFRDLHLSESQLIPYLGD